MIENKDLPKKLVTAGALIFNSQDELLIVKPKYTGRAHFLPGGIVELNESPREGCIREVLEELSLKISLGRLLVQDYEKRSDSLQLIFDGGLLTREQIDGILIQESELSYFRFVGRNLAQQLLSPKIQTRLPFCFRALECCQTIILEDGVAV